jgi:predicted acetyltransferase
MRARDIALSTLHPASLPVYRSYGWEIGGVAGWLRIPARALGALPADRRVAVRRLEGPADRDARHRCFDEWARTRHGAVVRSDSFWRWLDGDDDEPGVYAYGVDADDGGGLAGYVVFRQARRRDHWGYTITVLDHASHDDAALRALWRFLGDHAIQVETVEVYSDRADVLGLLLAEPLADVRRENPWLIRLVDLAAAVRARGYGGTGDGSVTLTVADPWPGAVGGSWRIEVAAGVGTAVPVAVGAVTVDVGALSALWAGAYPVATLAALGRVTGPADDIAMLGRLLAAPPPHLTDDF